LFIYYLLLYTFYRSNLDIKSEPEHDIYKDKSYMLLYDRLKRGKAERDLKKSVHTRDEIPKSILIELNKPGPDLSEAIKTIKPKSIRSNTRRSDQTEPQEKSKSKSKKDKKKEETSSIQDTSAEVQSFALATDKQNKSDDSNENFNNERSKQTLI
jgi:hypothetical protein